ncbi:MAG: hypothetical protein ABEJ36_03895 [Candidatus Nanosalina sp.]
MIQRYAEEEVDLDQAFQDLENGLKDPELVDSVAQSSFSDLDFQVKYTENGRYTATGEKHSINVEATETGMEIETAEKQGEDSYRTREYSFQPETVELPERSIGSWSENPIDSAVRSYARELYPEKQKPGREEAWSMELPPSERE